MQRFPFIGCLVVADDSVTEITADAAREQYLKHVSLIAEKFREHFSKERDDTQSGTLPWHQYLETPKDQPIVAQHVAEQIERMRIAFEQETAPLISAATLPPLRGLRFT